MAKKFMYVCLGILALTVAFHLGARQGSASFVDHTATGVIALTSDNHVLLSTDEVWQYRGTPENEWVRWTCKGYPIELPVPVSAIKFWEVNSFLDIQDNLWIRRGCSDNGEDYWDNVGPPPGSMATNPSTWGKIKGKFK